MDVTGSRLDQIKMLVSKENQQKNYIFFSLGNGAVDSVQAEVGPVRADALRLPGVLGAPPRRRRRQSGHSPPPPSHRELYRPLCYGV